MKFEHTNGLKYVFAEVSRFDDISKLFNIFNGINSDKLQINVTEGVGAGILYPKTDATVLGQRQLDEFNVAG